MRISLTVSPTLVNAERSKIYGKSEFDALSATIFISPDFLLYAASVLDEDAIIVSPGFIYFVN